MKTNEFIKEVEALGFYTETLLQAGVGVFTKHGECVLSIGSRNVYKIDCFYNAYDKLEPYTRRILFKLAVEYASTPLEERVEEKKYCIKFKANSVKDRGYKFINYDIEDNEYFVKDEDETDCVKTQFTKQEIKEYGLQKFADSDLFELVEAD